MKKIFTTFLAAILFLACEIDRLPHGSMDSGTIVDDPDAALEALLNGTYAQLKA
ncbi:hypothetical protein V5739_13435 [Salinimicrobium sp. TIG7-5_MAKvit]